MKVKTVIEKRRRVNAGYLKKLASIEREPRKKIPDVKAFFEIQESLPPKKARGVKENVFDELKRVADARGVTHSDIIRISRRVGKEVYAEEYK